MKKIATLLLLVLALNVSAQNDVKTLLKQADSLTEIDKSSHDIRYLLKDVLKQDPKNEEALFKMCLFHVNNRSNHYADDYADTLIEVNPNEAKNYWMRASVKLQERASINDLKQCVSDLEKAEELSGKTTNRLLRGQMLANYLTGKSLYSNSKGLKDYVNDPASFEDATLNSKKVKLLKESKLYLNKAIEKYTKLEVKDSIYAKEQSEIKDNIDMYLNLIIENKLVH